MESFQIKGREHAGIVAKAVMTTTGQATTKIEGASPIRRRILEFLSAAEKPLRPIDVASGTGLNSNTVRREMQDLHALGLLDKHEHQYYLRRRGE
jgi:predicted ArsR family transcriptional regulator